MHVWTDIWPKSGKPHEGRPLSGPAKIWSIDRISSGARCWLYLPVNCIEKLYSLFLRIIINVHE